MKIMTFGRVRDYALVGYSDVDDNVMLLAL